MIDRLATPITYFHKLTKVSPDKVSNLGDLIVKLSDHKSYDDNLRNLYSNDKLKYDKLKKTLPGFVLGEFTERKDEACKVYNPCLAFDIDNVSNNSDLTKLLDLTRKLNYVYASFPSVSGHGIRILVFTDSNQNNHKSYYQRISKDLEKGLGNEISYKIDSSTKNISRLWFYASVRKNEFYINESSVLYSIITDVKKISTQSIQTSEEIAENKKVEIIHQIVRNRSISGRNNFAMQFTRLSAEYGIGEDVILERLKSTVQKDFTLSELSKTVHSSFLKSSMKFNNAQLKVYAASTIGLDGLNNILKVKKVKRVQKRILEDQEKSKFVRMVEFLESRYDLRKNDLSHDIEIRKKEEDFYEILNDNDLSCELMENNFNNTERMLKNYLLSSKINNYNPLKDYLSSCPKWDESKPDYINQLSGYINTTNQEWFEKQFKKMLVRSLACALKLTPFNKQIFTLVGKQNDGKTSFLRFLCPSNLRSYYTENIRLDKDGLISLAQNIFINLDEIATIPYKDRDRIKSLVTADQIKERLPYASKATKIDRIANFMASTNEKELLTDDTGNVRWLIFEVENIKHDNGGKKGYSSNIDIDNVYAQAYFLLENNFKYSLTSEDIRMSESNNDHFVKTTSEVEILIDNFIQDPEQKAANFRSTTDIQHELSELYPRIKINHTMLGRALKSLGYKKTSLYTPEWGKSKKGYYIKHLSQPTTSPEDVWTN